MVVVNVGAGGCGDGPVLPTASAVAAAMMKSKLIESIPIQIAIGNKMKWIDVPGVQVTTHFAITESHNDFAAQYTLTHMLTGHAVYSAQRQASLRALAKCLERTGKWDFTDPMAVKEPLLAGHIVMAFERWRKLKVAQ